MATGDARFVTGIPSNKGRMRIFQETQIMPTSIRVEEQAAIERLREKGRELADYAQLLDFLEHRMKRYRESSPEDAAWVTALIRPVSEVAGRMRVKLADIRVDLHTKTH